MISLNTKLIVSLLVFAAGAHNISAAESLKFETDPEQKLDVAYRIFKTQNIWNQLLIDTRDGRVWQVAFTIETNGYRGKVPINPTPLINPPGKVGRFTLYPTQNMWTYLMLDTEEGNVWQCQFSLAKDGRFIIPVVTPEQQELTESLSVEEMKELQTLTISPARRQELMQKAPRTLKERQK